MCIATTLAAQTEHLAANVRTALAVGASTDPVHRTAGLQIDFEFGPHKDDAVGFGGDEAFPDFIRGCGEIENKVQWSLLGHGDLLGVCVGLQGAVPMH